MPVGTTTVIAVVSLLGAASEAAITLRWYEPPPREDGDEPPSAVFEAALFFVLTAVLFAALGSAVSFVGQQVPPYGRLATFLLTAVGFYSAYGTYTGRLGDVDSRASPLMGVVAAVVLGFYPLALFAAAAL